MHSPTSSNSSQGCSENQSSVFESDLTLPDKRLGKVRDTYTLPGAAPDGHDAMLIVASDRISAFDVIMPTPIAGKGMLLTEIAEFWLRWIEHQDLCHTHLISTDTDAVPDSAFTGKTTREHLQGRVTIGRKCRVIPVECVVRGYLEGSGWNEYQKTQQVCKIDLPGGIEWCGKIPAPIFTPASRRGA
jgi:phosphoribosylaminoimidazole-succinocarboxamide synthase